MERAIPILEGLGYDVKERLGTGGFGSVFRVYSAKYKYDFAVKVFDISRPELSRNISSYSTEIATLTNLVHTNIISIYKHFSEGNFLFILLEYCPGGSLYNYLNSHNAPDNQDLLCKCRDLLYALQYCHSHGVCHRDIKPSNILIDAHGRVKLADFGLSKSNTHNTRIQRFGGSLPYLPPEVLQMKKFDPEKSDIWQLGITFHVMFSNRVPYLTKTAKELHDKISNYQLDISDTIPKDVLDVIMMMLREDPTERPTCEMLLGHPILQVFIKKPAYEAFHGSKGKRFSKPVILPLLKVSSFGNTSSGICNRRATSDFIHIPQARTFAKKRISLSVSPVSKTETAK